MALVETQHEHGHSENGNRESERAAATCEQRCRRNGILTTRSSDIST